MSLINEALKKAQNIQARPPSPAAPAAPSPAPKLKTKAAQVVPPPLVAVPPQAAAATGTRRPAGNGKAVLAIAGGLFIVAMGVLGFALYIILGRSSADTAVVQTPPVATESPDAAAAATDTSGSSTDDANSAVHETAAPAATVAAAPAPPANAEPAPPPKRVNRPNARVQDFVNKIQVTGVRSGERARVLMNDRVYTIGEVVNAELDVRLTSVTAHNLGFEDAEGNTYDLHF